MFEIKRNIQEKSFGGVYEKTSAVYFFDILLAKIVQRYTGTEWGLFKFIPTTKIAEQMHVSDSASFGEANDKTLKELARVIA